MAVHEHGLIAAALALLALAAGARQAPDADERRAVAQASWARFPVFVWRQDHFGREAPEELLAPFGGTSVERDHDETWVLERGLDFYVGHGPGREALHPEREREDYAQPRARWLRERDPALLVRAPCLTDPATVSELRERLARTLAARGGRHGIGVSLGDEVSLTPSGDPLDLCRSETCEAAWSEAWRARPSAGSEVPDGLTDPARRAVAAGEVAAIGPWLARRRFHHDVLLDLLRDLAADVREASPGTAVGLLGVGGVTAFGGVDLARLQHDLDFVESYATDDARELLHTLRRPGQRVLATVFPEEAPADAEDAGDADDAAGAAWQVWESWLRGVDGLVVWSDRELVRSPAYAAGLARALAGVRALRERLPGFAPRPAGAAVVHSADSVAVSWLRDALLDGPTWPNRLQGFQERSGTRERDLRGWLRLLEDCGVLPGAVPIELVGAATVERFPLLVANHLLVVGDAERAALEAFLDAGGHLVVHGELGWIDAEGRAPNQPLLARLLERAPARVHEPLHDPAHALELRLGGARGLRDEIASWLAEAGVVAPPLSMRGEAAALPWLVGASRAPEGTWTVALLPNLADSAQRAAHLRALALELEPAAGYELRWIRPLRWSSDPTGSGEPGVPLPPGEAAVVQLVPRPPGTAGD